MQFKKKAFVKYFNSTLKKFCSFKKIPIFAIPTKKVLINNAKVAHLVEHDLAKVGVAGSSPVFRSDYSLQTLVVELVDTRDLKSRSQQCE